MKHLTILTVSYGHRELLLENMRLAQSLHADFKNAADWYVAENSPADHPDRFTEDEAGFIILEGNGETGKGISHHHATALNNLLRNVKLSRYVLILDPDFFLLFQNWANIIPSYMLSKGLSFFGVPWHPRHNENYRYFPAVHCFAFDSHVVDPTLLDFTPMLEILAWKQSRIARLLHLIPVIGYRLTRRSWDTGTRIWLRFCKKNNIFRFEHVTPIYKPNAAHRTIKHRLVESLLLDNMCIEPKMPGYYTTTTFQDKGWLKQPIPTDWETFVWNESPFGIHVRRSYGHQHRNDAYEMQALRKALDELEQTIIHQHLPI